MTKKLLSAGLLLILLVAWTTPALAQGGDGGAGQIVFGRDLMLDEGDVVDGDAVVFGGNLQAAAGSRIDGDLVVFGGRIEIDGEVGGDVAAIGGDVRLGSTARITGKATSFGGRVVRDEGAEVGGGISEVTKFDFGWSFPAPTRFVDARPPQLTGSDFFEGFFRIVRALLLAVVLAVIGLLVVLFLPDHTQVVGGAIRDAGPASFGVGLLTFVVGLMVVTLLAITCCLLPVGMLLALALMVAALYGWVVAGYLLGERLLPLFQKDKGEPTPVVSALVGVFTITLLQQGLMVLGRLPCLGFVFWLLSAGLWLVFASVGLGAVVLTRFGTRFYAGTAPVGIGPSVVPTVAAVGPTDIGVEAGEESTQAAPPQETEAESDEGAAPPGDQEDNAALDPGGDAVDSGTTTNREEEASSDG